jgi:hypothetical protein
VLRTVALPRGPELSLGNPITLLTADGPRVAFTSGDCGTWIWGPPARPTPIGSCFNPDGSSAVTKLLALAGRTVVWVVDDLTIDQYEYALAAAPPYRRHVQLAYLYSDDQGGEETEHLLAAGTSTAFEVVASDENGNVGYRRNWILDLALPPGGRSCPDDGSDTGSTSVVGCRLLAPAPHARLLALGPSRIVEQAGDGSVLVATLSGKTIRNWRLTPGYPVSAALDGNAVDVLDGLVLRRFDIASGKLVVRRRIPAALVPAKLAGAAPGLVAYLRGATLHLLRLGDGADITLVPPTPVEGTPLAALDDSGLFYAYTGAGRIDFLPVGKLRALFSSRP